MGHAQTHSGSVKLLIYALFRWWYLNSVQTDSPAPPGFTKTPRTTAMTFQSFERQADRFAPLALLVIGMLTAFATAGLGV